MNYYLNENLARMFFGIYMITVADPQILWNDGFYPLVDVTIPDGLVLEAAPPGGAVGAQPRHRSGVRPVRRPAGADQPGAAQRGGVLVVAALHVLRPLHVGRPGGRVVPALLDRLRRHPGRPLGDGPDGHSLWPSFVNIPCEYLESYYPLRIEKWETVADTGGAGLHRGGNGVDVAYVFEEPGEIAIHDDRWLTWLESPPRKIASIGIHLSKWISTHGYALNVDLDPAPFTDWITACGLDGYQFTSMARELGRPLAVDDVRPAAAQALADVFGFAFEELPADALPAPAPRGLTELANLVRTRFERGSGACQDARNDHAWSRRVWWQPPLRNSHESGTKV